MRVEVDRTMCSGHARCNAYAPEVFELDDDGMCLIPNPVVAPDLEGQARLGEQSCPERAIAVRDSD
jgi:ferredoxin